jgi:hypothetical protein
MSDRPKDKKNDNLQQNNKQPNNLEENTVVLVKHYPLVVREVAGPLVAMPPDSLLVQLTNG